MNKACADLNSSIKSTGLFEAFRLKKEVLELHPGTEAFLKRTLINWESCVQLINRFKVKQAVKRLRVFSLMVIISEYHGAPRILEQDYCAIER